MTGKAQRALGPPSRQVCGSGMCLQIRLRPPCSLLCQVPTQYLSCCFFSMAADASSRVPLSPHPSLTHTLTSNHIAVKGFLRNLGQLLNHLGFPLLADESLNHHSLSAEAPHLPTVASPMSLWGPCLEIPPYLQLSHLCPQLAVSSLALSVGTTFSCLIQGLLQLSPPGVSD